MKKIIYILLFLPLLSFSQEKFTLSGKITDSESGEDLIGVTIYDDVSKKGTITNTYGFYSLSMEEGQYTITISYIGYKSEEHIVKLNSNKTLNFELSTESVELNEVVITGERKDENIVSTSMGVDKLQMDKIEKLPVLFGEKDVLKTIQLLPGISTSSEGSAGFNVRGGSVDQNLILLDEATVYSASHLMGFISVFNSDALKNVTVYKGGIPANFGGRASSVLDIQMNDGNSKKFENSGGIGLISSRLTLEGPIINDKISFIVSGRRSYADLVLKALPGDIITNETDLYFYDLNAKINYKINQNNRIYLSGYFGKDVFGFGEMGMNWGNSTGTLRWNHLYTSKLFSNTSLIYSKYDYGFGMGETMQMTAGIEDMSFKQDMTYYLNPSNTIKFGFSTIYHKFYPGELTSNETVDFEVILDQKQALESGVYITNKHKISERLNVDYGVRFSLFNQMGPGTSYIYDYNNVKVDSTIFESGEIIENYYAFEPRASLSYKLGSNNSVKVSYNRMAQYLHLLSNSTSGQATDMWIPSGTNLKPLLVNQYAVGYFQNFADNSIETSIEVYYKDLNDVSDFENGTDIMLNENLEAYILHGQGRSYGMEFYVKKKYGDFTGWVSYTISRTENKIEGINDFKWYPTKYDKTHDISLVSSYNLSKKLTFSAAWIYYTGNAVTFPSGKYQVNNQLVPLFTDRNGYRMPNYHRLDLSLSVKGKEHEKFESNWDFSIYNIYNRKNAYSIDFKESENNPGTTEAVKLSLFGIVPSITYNFKF